VIDARTGERSRLPRSARPSDPLARRRSRCWFAASHDRRPLRGLPPASTSGPASRRAPALRSPKGRASQARRSRR